MNVLVTGGAGFIGSHIVERALSEGASVRVLDNLSSGKMANIEAVLDKIEFFRGDILSESFLEEAVRDVDVIFHEAAIVSVPQSIREPIKSHMNGSHATLKLMQSAREAGVSRVVIASSAAVYGDAPALPKDESMPLEPISPYAATKAACESYARAFARSYHVDAVSLRYFNVFGPRQDPSSPYSGVISKFCKAFVNDDPITIFGDGEQSRDFVYVDNVVEANWLAAMSKAFKGEAINVGCGQGVTLNKMIEALNSLTASRREAAYDVERPGDIRHSRADLTKARRVLGYKPKVGFLEGLSRTLEWYQRGGE